MPRPTNFVTPSPIEIKRFPWMRRLHVHSPKLARPLVLFSYESLNLWALIESRPTITRFCEHPGHIEIDGQRVVADFWVEGEGRQEFVRLDEGIQLEPEHAGHVHIYRDVTIDRVTQSRFDPYRQWIANWFQINPYIVSNARFVTSQMLTQAWEAFSGPRPLFDAEHALRKLDPQLARSATFMLLHQGKLMSDDLMHRPLDGATVLYRSAAVMEAHA